jgi:hypothetical protein
LQTQQQASAPVFQVDAVDQVPVFLAAKTWMLLKIAATLDRHISDTFSTVLVYATLLVVGSNSTRLKRANMINIYCL